MKYMHHIHALLEAKSLTARREIDRVGVRHSTLSPPLLSEKSTPIALFQVAFILKIEKKRSQGCFIGLSHDPEELRSSKGRL